jgi:hypothetical protein
MWSTQFSVELAHQARRGLDLAQISRLSLGISFKRRYKYTSVQWLDVHPVDQLNVSIRLG